MAQLVKLVKHIGIAGEESLVDVWVNPLNVDYVEPETKGKDDNVRIYLTEKHTMLVKGTLQHVSSAIAAGLQAAPR